MRLLAIAGLAAAVLIVTGTAAAQYRQRGINASVVSHMATPSSFDGSFNFCRAAYRPNPYGDGGGWLTDYPLADIDLSTRLSELTKTRVGFDPSGEPRHLIVRLTDDELFQCPFLMMAEVGRVSFNDEEAARLRAYLLKGGFLWADDFWGSYAWEVWTNEIQKVFPPGEFPMVDIPIDHPIFRTLFTLQRIPQVPGIGYWSRGRGTSERGADSAQVHTRGIFDRNGRLMVFITHNTDFGDAWEREGDDPDYFYQFSVEGYAVAVDVLLYAMTH